MKINYIALDGKIFEDELDCRKYEEDLLFKTILKGIDCRDEEGKKITDLEEIRQYACRISIDSNESYKKFCDVLEDNEIALEGINEAGEYVYDNDYDRFMKIKSLNEVIEEIKDGKFKEITIYKVNDDVNGVLYYTI